MNRRMLRLVAMRVILAAALGILSANLGWAIAWAVQDHRNLTLDAQAAATVLDLSAGSNYSDISQQSQLELRTVLAQANASFAISSQGEGKPEMVVFDPARNFGWFPIVTAQDLASTTAIVFPFMGSFASTQPPLYLASFFQGSVSTRSSINSPTGSVELQYARPLQDLPLGPGRSVVTSTDPRVLAEVSTILERQGLVLNASQSASTADFLKQDPLFVVSSLLALGGLVSVSLFWWYEVSAKGAEIYVRRMFGGSGNKILRTMLAKSLVVFATGFLSGSIIALAAAWSVGAAVAVRLGPSLAITGLLAGLLFASATHVAVVATATLSILRSDRHA